MQQDNREQLLQGITEALQGLNIDALNLVNDCFIKTIAGSERYSINTTEERLAELKAAAAAQEEQRKAERAAKEAEQAAYNAVSLYERNATMKLIGNTSYYTYCCPAGEYGSGFDDILQAHKYDWITRGLIDTGMDFFAFGMICGIKEQRKRGKKAKCM